VALGNIGIELLGQAASLGLGVSSTYWMGLAFGFVINFGFGLTLPALIALTLQRLPESHRGRGMGLWMSSFFCAQFLCPPAFALLMQAIGAKLTDIQKQLLHSNVATTGLYLETITRGQNPFIGQLTALLGVRGMMAKVLTPGE